jgi:hypothetical protein|tara:strand:- start:373 stop:564 length:192 start_codon:yes stop_codon:yes gene_type:complete
MKLDENFLSNFLRKVKDGVVDSAGKKMLKDNPKLAQKTKEIRKANRDYEDYLKKFAKENGIEM